MKSLRDFIRRGSAALNCVLVFGVEPCKCGLVFDDVVLDRRLSGETALYKILCSGKILWSEAMKISVDHRERASGLLELLRKNNVIIEVQQLPFGDYIINNSITIERKTARDFIISIIDGRLFSQLSNLRKNCLCPILLIEGNPYKIDVDMDPAAIKGALISVQTIWYVPIVFTHSKEDTVGTLLMIAKQDESYMDVVPLRGGYRPKRLKSRQLYILQGLPKVGPTIAKRLLDHFGCVSKVMNAPIDELMKVDGVGAASAAQIRDVLDRFA